MLIDLSNFLFFDIETAPIAKSFNDAPEKIQDSFITYCNKKFLKDNPDLNYEDLFLEKAALIPEFAEIVCISIGRIKDNEFKISSLVNKNDNSEEILNKLALYFNKLGSNIVLTGYNIEIFDIPFLVKHMIKYGIKIPSILNTYKIKPWERQTFDIFDFWRNSRFECMPSLEMVAIFLDCTNPKETINGSNVGELFWGTSNIVVSRTEGLDMIRKYCEIDVKTSMEIVVKLKESGCL